MMSTYTGGNEQSRERVVALLLLLQRAFVEKKPLTQEEILRELKVDEYPVSSKGPKKILAYEGRPESVRQKFERDKKNIRELGFEIETVENVDGLSAYQIDPSSGYAPIVHFTEEEERYVKFALRFCGFGASGAFSVFNEVPASDGGLEASNYYGPVVRALNLRRRVTFDYQSNSRKTRTLEPITNVHVDGATYLVARTPGTDEIKGYRYSRIMSMPSVLADTFEVDDETVAAAREWRPQYQKTPQPTDIFLETNENYAELIQRQYPDAVLAKKSKGRVEVAVTFDNANAALRFILEAADRVRLTGPKELRKELAEWLEHVNKGKTPKLADITFSNASSSNVLGQTLQLLHAVYNADGGLSVLELANRFALDPRDVRLIMNRMVTMEPMAHEFNGTWRFPARVSLASANLDENIDDDEFDIYHAEFEDAADEPPAIMWRDLFELNIALHEAARLYDDPALSTAIEKIEGVAKDFVRVEHSINEQLLADINAAVQNHEQIKMLYVAGYSDEAQERTIEPSDVKELNGHSYVRAYCTTRNAWRTFRVDRISAIVAKGPAEANRPADPTPNWLTRLSESGDEVVCIVNAATRYLFEPLPGAKWTTLGDDAHAVMFRVATPEFLDHLMLLAGAGAQVVTPKYKNAGHELAERIRKQI